mgnify:CR=1 FL=1
MARFRFQGELFGMSRCITTVDSISRTRFQSYGWLQFFRRGGFLWVHSLYWRAIAQCVNSHVGRCSLLRMPIDERNVSGSGVYCDWCLVVPSGRIYAFGTFFRCGCFIPLSRFSGVSEYCSKARCFALGVSSSLAQFFRTDEYDGAGTISSFGSLMNSAADMSFRMY